VKVVRSVHRPRSQRGRRRARTTRGCAHQISIQPLVLGGLDRRNAGL